MSTDASVANEPGFLAGALTRDQARAVFGQVMGLVALTLGFLALGAYIGRDLSGGWGILFFIASFGCIFGLNVASARRKEQLATRFSSDSGSCWGLRSVLSLAPTWRPIRRRYGRPPAPPVGS